MCCISVINIDLHYRYNKQNKFKSKFSNEALIGIFKCHSPSGFFMCNTFSVHKKWKTFEDFAPNIIYYPYNGIDF